MHFHIELSYKGVYHPTLPRCFMYGTFTYTFHLKMWPFVHLLVNNLYMRRIWVRYYHFPKQTPLPNFRTVTLSVCCRWNWCCFSHWRALLFWKRTGFTARFPLGKQPFKRGHSGEPINFNRGGNSNISGIFYPDLWGNDPSWHICQMGWFNHQLEVSGDRRCINGVDY